MTDGKKERVHVKEKTYRKKTRRTQILTATYSAGN